MPALLLAMLLIASSSAQAEIYKWVDEEGKTHFSDVKPASKRSQELKPPPRPPAATEKQTVAERVTLYATSWCTYCAQARQHFRTKGIPFTEYDIEKSESARLMYEQLGGSGVPLILVGDRRLNGFSVSGFDSLYRSPR